MNSWILAYSYIIWFFDVISDSFTLPKSSKYINTKFNQRNEKILNDDLFKSDFNIKSRTDKHKIKLGWNNIFINSQNSPKINIIIFDTLYAFKYRICKKKWKKENYSNGMTLINTSKKLKKDKNTKVKKTKAYNIIFL